MKYITHVQIKNYGALLVLCALSLFAYANFVSAHGGEVEEEASEALVEIAIALGENYHIEIEAETLDGKRIPELHIEVTATNVATGEETIKTLHGMFGGNYHYGTNMALPEGEYSFVFHIEPPTFMREGSRAGSWTESVDAETTLTAVNNPTDEVEAVIKTTEDMVIVFVAEPAQPMWAFPQNMEEMGHMDDIMDVEEDDIMNVEEDEMIDNMMDGRMGFEDEADVGHDGRRETVGITFFTALALIVGMGLGLLLGRSRKTPVAVETAPESTEGQG